MKKKIIFIVLQLASLSGYTQNIKDIFLSLPEKDIGMSIIERTHLWSEYLNNKPSHKLDRLEVVDKKNAYIKWIKSGGDIQGELTIWANSSDSSKLVGLIRGVSATEYYTNFFGFYRWNGKKITKLNQNEIVPKLTINNFLKPQYAKKYQNIEYDLVYSLPKNGKDILVFCRFIDDIDDKIIMGNTIKLLWNNGHFIKGNPYLAK